MLLLWSCCKGQLKNLPTLINPRFSRANRATRQPHILIGVAQTQLWPGTSTASGCMALSCLAVPAHDSQRIITHAYVFDAEGEYPAGPFCLYFLLVICMPNSEMAFGKTGTGFSGEARQSRMRPSMCLHAPKRSRQSLSPSRSEA